MHCSGLEWHPEVATQMVLASEDDRLPVIQIWDLRFASSPLRVLENHARCIKYRFDCIGGGGARKTGGDVDRLTDVHARGFGKTTIKFENKHIGFEADGCKYVFLISIQSKILFYLRRGQKRDS